MARGGYRVGSGPKKGTKYKKRGSKTEIALGLADDLKKDKKPESAPNDMEASEFLRKVWNDPAIDYALRIRAAEIAVRSNVDKKGKKEEKTDRAKQAGSSGKFAAGRPPLQLVKK